MYSLDEGLAPPPRKRPYRISIELKCMFIAHFVLASSQKKNQTDNFNSLGATEGGKNALKRVKKIKIKFLLYTNIKVRHMFLHVFFQGLFKVIDFRSVALFTYKLQAILYFFTDRPFFHPVPYPIYKKKYFFSKKSFTFLFIKRHKFHGDCVKNQSARTKITTGLNFENSVFFDL